MKHNILFVDDEQNILHGLKNMLFSYRKKWKFFFAIGGEEALEILKKNNIDIIVSDMRMPGMNGVELLEKVKNLYPQTVRIILSGHSSDELVMKSVSYIHQFLAKPCDAEYLIEVLGDAINLREKIEDEKMRDIITSLGSLPTIPKLYEQLDYEIRNSDPSMQRIAEIISKDVAMTAKILQIVNSAFFALPRNISSSIEAVNFLGVSTIKTLILSFELFTSFKMSNNTNLILNKIWNHSLMVSIGSREIMKSENANKSSVDSAYTSGMLHDVGRLIFIQYHEYSDKLKNFKFKNSKDIISFEKELFRSSHEEIGAYLLGLWGLEKEITQTIKFHHNPAASGNNEFSIVTAVYLANSIINSDEPDYDYLESIGIADGIDKYIEIINGIKK